MGLDVELLCETLALATTRPVAGQDQNHVRAAGRDRGHHPDHLLLPLYGIEPADQCQHSAVGRDTQLRAHAGTCVADDLPETLEVDAVMDDAQAV